ncbi:MAG TPA: hypothetical protein EYP41_22920 [Anaerolineae bacterium]|nr:hypothetical protein [Anaerolineae bacterium]
MNDQEPRPSLSYLLRLWAEEDSGQWVWRVSLTPVARRFEITLTASGETTCGYPDFTYDYTAVIEGETMSLTQIVNGIVTSRPFDPATGAFTMSQAGLPGTEIYDGVLTWDGQTISVKGTYTYVDDPNQACEGVWQIGGSGNQ